MKIKTPLFVQKIHYFWSKRPRPINYIIRYLDIESETKRLKGYLSPYSFSFMIIILIFTYPYYKDPLTRFFTLPISLFLTKMRLYKEKDDSFGNSIENFSKILVQRVLSAKEIQQSGALYVENLIKIPVLQDSLLKLLIETLQKPAFLTETKSFLKTTALEVIGEPLTQEKFSEFMIKTLNKTELKAELANVMQWVFQQEKTKENLIGLFKEGFEDNRLRKSLIDALSAGFSEVLNSEETSEKIRLFSIFLIEGENTEETRIKDVIDRIVNKVVGKDLVENKKKQNEFERKIGII